MKFELVAPERILPEAVAASQEGGARLGVRVQGGMGSIRESNYGARRGTDTHRCMASP